MPRSQTYFQKGTPSWNAGLSVSGMTGRKHSNETKAKMRTALLGAGHPSWTGGKRGEHYNIRRSAAYRDWRNAVYSRDGYACVLCGDKSSPDHRVRLEADHIKPFAQFPELRFDVSNGRTLCVTCHRKTDTWGNGGKPSFRALEASRPTSK